MQGGQRMKVKVEEHKETDLQMDNKETLKQILLHTNPVLFLGAGFSYGSENHMGKIPKGTELKNEILDIFFLNQVDDNDLREIQKYNLQDLCQCVHDLLGKKEELKTYILSRFKDVVPKDFHLLLTAYEWKKIYTVNVDDLVENICRINGIKLTIQNKSVEKKCESQLELIKLHGCVNEPTEPITFSKSEYTALIKDKNFKLDKLMTDIVDRDVIFVGASLDESDIDFYISQYEAAGFLRKGKLIFVDPFPSVKLRARIKSLNGILFEWTTEDFLKYVASLHYNPTELERNKKILNYSGLYLYREVLECFKSGQVYESRLYEGYTCKWEDVLNEWIFETSYIKDILELCKSVGKNNYPCFSIAIYGNRFTGKDCALKQIGASLYKLGYEVIEYKGKSLNIEALNKYIFSSGYTKFALLIENASYYYGLIEKLLQYDWQGRQLLIITTSRTYYHFRKKYYLDDNPYHEYEIKDKIYKQDAEIIYDKITEKGYSGDLSLNKEIGVSQICRQGSYINLFTELTYGQGFRKRIKDISRNIFSVSESIKSLYGELVIFDKADLPYYPSELLMQQYSIDFNIFGNREYEKLSKEQRLIVDYIRITDNGIVLKNRLLIDAIWRELNSDNTILAIREILRNIASYISEDENNYWRIVFESLLKEDVLSKVFKINSTQILELYYGLKGDFENISYYWLQLGIAEQKTNDYAKALNHLKMAQKIRPRAYQIQHAIARNYLKNANMEKDATISATLFETGERMMMELINSNENYKAKAKYFSIHCYAHEKIKYMMKHPESINKRGCLALKRYIDMILANWDDYSKMLVKEYVVMLRNNDLLSILSLKPGDAYYMVLSEGAEINYIEDLDLDYLIESF